MNRRIITFLSIILCLLTAASLFACKKDSTDETDKKEELLWQSDGTVTFADIPGTRFISDTLSGETLKCGTEISFEIEVSSFYEGSPVVIANGKKIDPEDNIYTVKITKNTTVTVEGIKLKENSLTGSGTGIDDPYVISTPIDLLYIAQEVNAGNSDYLGAYYQLDADLDFGGEEMEVIGNGAIDSAYFEGYFDGQGHTVSNFELNTSGTSYVGLFGILQVNLSNSQGGTVYKLNLKDYTIRAKADDETLFCGSVAGYGVGANLILCNAENGRIEIYGDQNKFSYVGGLFGFQQGFDNSVLTYLSSVAYCTADIDIDCCEGAIYCAGGITGYLSASTGNTPASINNSYTTGDIQGAMLSGGIAGYVGEETCIVNCYSTGIISSQSSSLDSDNSEIFCHTYAGGIAGLACPDSIIAESFATGKIYAKASLGADYQHAGGILGYADKTSLGSFAANPATVYQCFYAENGKSEKIDLKSSDFLKSEMHWTDCDWNWSDGKYPEINTEENADYSFSVTLKFPGMPDTVVTDFSAYMPMSFWYLEDILPSSLTGNDGDTHTSYGYFFDEAHTLPLPDSYVPTHDLTVYVATADYSDVAGGYVLVTGNPQSTAYLTLNTDGSYTYTDGASERTSLYTYNGETVVLRNARLTRYSPTVSGLDSYGFSDFAAKLCDGNLEIIGGFIYDENAEGAGTEPSAVAFDENSPLIAVRRSNVLTGTYRSGNRIYTFSVDGSGSWSESGSVTDFTYKRDGNTLTLTQNGTSVNGSVNGDIITVNGASLTACDIFRGSWCVDSKSNKVFTFDGAGNWYYEYFGYRSDSKHGAQKVVYENSSGQYTVNGNAKLELSGGMSGSAVFENGALKIKTSDAQFDCHMFGSLSGTWVYPEYHLTLKLNGISNSGEGSGRLEFVYPDETVEFFDLTYSFDNLRDGVLCLYSGEEVLGFMNYTPGTDTLSSTMYVGTQASYMQNVPLYRIDELKGEWISDSSNMSALTFNGLGSYNVKDIAGEVEIGEKTVQYLLNDATLTGSFLVNDKVYNISYDETENTLILKSKDETVKCQRKDSFGSMTLRDSELNSYTFDGRGAMASQGTMTVTYANGNTKEYKYTSSSNKLTVYDNGKKAGELTAGDETYILSLEKEIPLRIVSEFTGDWAMSGSLENLVIGDMDLGGNMNGIIKETETVFTLEDDHVTFMFEDTKFYIIKIGEKNLIISNALQWYNSNDPLYCAAVDDIFGTWENSLGASYQFDGMSQSTLTSGTAQSGLEENAISFYYKLDSHGWYVLWTQISGETQIYRINMCDIDTKRAFIKDDRAFTVEEGDKLYDTVFKDEKNGVEYSFDGFGKVETDDGKSYEYTVEALDQYTGTATVKIIIDGEEFTAKLDFSIANNFTLTISED